MAAPDASTIPVIDVSPLLDGSTNGLRHVAAELDRVYSTVGFGAITGHGVDPALVAGVFEASKRFHALPAAAKEAIEINAAHRGFIAMASSTIVTSSVAEVRKPNQSESLMVCHELADDHPDIAAGLALAGPNQWPGELPGIREPILAYVDALNRLGRLVARAVAVALGAPADRFEGCLAEPCTFLRLLRYPARPADAPADLYGAAPHTDYGFLTFLAQDHHPGLQVRARDGAWLDCPTVPGAFVLNSADLLHRWSNGRWVSTPHRVINRTGEERYSVPFFFDPHVSTVVETLPSCVPDGEEPRFAPVVYGDYLMERLRKNYRRHQD